MGSLSGKGGDVCEELRNRMTDVWRRRYGEDIVLGHSGWREENISCGDISMEMELVVCQLWW